MLKLKKKQQTELINNGLKLDEGVSDTVRALIQYATAPEHSKDAADYLHGFTVLRQLVDAGETEAKRILGVEG